LYEDIVSYLGKVVIGKKQNNIIRHVLFGEAFNDKLFVTKKKKRMSFNAKKKSKEEKKNEMAEEIIENSFSNI